MPISDLVRRSILLASSFNGGGAPSRLYSSKQLCCSSLSPCSLIIATGHAGAQETLRVGRAIANSWSFDPVPQTGALTGLRYAPPGQVACGG